MSVDLDEMFADLSRDGDMVPVGPAEGARRRGARRSRNRVVAAALAILLVAGGAGAVVWQRGHRAEPVLPATPNSPIRGLQPLGDPLDAGAGRTWHYTAASEGRLFAVSVPSAASVDARENRGFAADERTGDPLWSTPAELGGTDVPVPIPGTVLLREAAPRPIMHLLDPATGTERWSLPHALDDQLVFHPDVLVRMHDADGMTEGLDIRTGARLWSAPAGADRPRWTSGISAADGTRRWSPAGNDEFSDGYLFQQLASGRMVIRDVRTGEVRNSIAKVLSDQSGYTTVHDGSVVWPVGNEIRAAALGDDSTARVIYTYEEGQEFQGLFGCGQGRICVSLGSPDGRLVAVDIASARELWSAKTSGTTGGAGSRSGRTLTIGMRGAMLHDADGRVLYEGGSQIGWIDDANLLEFDAGPVAVLVSAADGTRTVLGEVPGATVRPGAGADCAWSTETLACADGSLLRRYRFVR
ncbi:hypothetical protein ACTI_10510 [Actinoplanes sp. OR16]|uniref:outer membrane protein assembly factor BamB family protein n=1 Tax=Actinoplanes sp. OR16 TaxID=946334 RepID=UPI000F6DEEE8|nr:PQQ-binding-like beta-propeller repeat protein [Actinoplanes sp. OR16]BBH64366.1 hypothetical protein ACTI_10510 [Actinoplanes sp. OR16]